MPLIPDEKLEEVRQATDIVDLVSRYVPLKRAGSSYKANCPFHQEKTPSFHVFPETQTWKCFGCGKGGNAFHFLMERDRLTFPEAVRSLARDAGIEIGRIRGDETGGGESRERLYRVLEWACRFFETCLRSDAGKKAVDYCRRRELAGETALRFRLGYAPEGWQNLIRAAERKRIDLDLLERAGLVRRKEGGGAYDYFRDRLVFPIFDVRDRVIAFGARALDDSEPKYLNSPDTALFKKGRTLYALNRARGSALRERRLALVEGYTDVIMAHQHGVEWVVAGLGTGLTREHAALAKRFAERIDLVYDADTAGRRAAERALDVFLETEADVRVVTLPDGLDPCDFLLERGNDAFLASVESGQEVFEFLLDRAREKHDVSTLSGRTAAVDDVLGSVAKVSNDVTRDMLIRRTAEKFGVSEVSVRGRLRLFSGKGDVLETGPAAAPSEAEGAAEDPRERLAIEAVLCRPDLASRLAEVWPPERFRHPVYREIAQAVVGMTGGNGGFDPAALAGRLQSPAAAARVAEVFAAGTGKKDLERQFEDCVERLRTADLLVETERAFADARQRGDDEECRRLERELFRLRSRVR